MVTKVAPAKKDPYCRERFVPEKYWATRPDVVPGDPCKDASGAWKYFYVRVRNKPVCVTFLNPPESGVEGYTRRTDRKNCPVYKPMGPLVLTDETCELVLAKPGCYEFRPAEGDTFPADFDWTQTELEHEALSNIIQMGGTYAIL